MLVPFSGASYVQVHAPRSGDCDALLTLWTTLTLIAAFEWLHAETPAARRRWRAGAAAFMTKASQGLVFLPAIVAWGLAWGHLAPRLREPAPWLAALAVVAVGVGHDLPRERLDPGHFAATSANDLLGRFATVIEDHAGGPLTCMSAVRADALHAAGYLLRPALLREAGTGTVAVPHPGLPGGPVRGAWYVAPLDDDAKALRADGIRVRAVRPEAPLPADADHAMACADPPRPPAGFETRPRRVAGHCAPHRRSPG